MPEDPIYRAIGAQVREARRLRGMSQAALAKIAQTTQPVISRIEHHRSFVEIETLVKIAEALDSDLRADFVPRSVPEVTESLASSSDGN